jgi:hypothetical protein
MNTREPTQGRSASIYAVHRIPEGGTGSHPRAAQNAVSGARGLPAVALRRQVACYGWKTVGRVRAKPRSLEKPVVSKHKYRFPIRATIAGALPPSSRSAGARCRRRFTALVIPFLSASELYAPRGLAQLIVPTALRPRAFALRPIAYGRQAGRRAAEVRKPT